MKLVKGSKFDIHTGGIGSEFQHHNNETAQSEAHFDSDSSVNYFLHNGHLTIAGCTMSKSLKNFITIQQALEKYTSRQIRLLFLLYSWSTSLDYSDHEMNKALSYEKTLNEFFINTEKNLGSFQELNHASADTKFEGCDLILNNDFSTAKQQIHLALCDSIDMPTVMENIRQLIAQTNLYMNAANGNVHHVLLTNIALYIIGLLDIFGLYSNNTYYDYMFSRSDEPETLKTIVKNIGEPYVEQFALFRDVVHLQSIEQFNLFGDAVRSQAIEAKYKNINKKFFAAYNDIKNKLVAQLGELGARLEHEASTNKATMKFYNPETLIHLWERKREQALLAAKK
ncbi:unnamed protein product [Rotaria sordida]|uniref:tRNA synthetases class I catalytic domain-containing protein n=2 Tax=Rotaria sordida TaxID=392033 RepID=A0A819KI30_9BILA|nr:unnamed protein product [Rotaria sordida]CAF3947747.1 unnamed protein product [Rotaria sordida]